MSKKIQCDLCGKLLDPEKEKILYEIHSLRKLNSYEDRDDEIENDICSVCYNKLKHIISEKKWEDNMIPNKVLERCLSKDNVILTEYKEHIMAPPRIVESMGM